MSKQAHYHVMSHGDNLSPGSELKLEHRVYSDNLGDAIAPFKDKPIAELEALREQSASAEQAVFDRLREAVKEWEQCAAHTLFLNGAIEYAKVEPTRHSDNRWCENQFGNWEISNATYVMYYHIYERTKYDRELKMSVPIAWDLTWHLYTHAPEINRNGHGHRVKIAGQDRKQFTTKEDMQRYLNGRIGTYAHLFTEDCPPVPSKYAHVFKVNGHLLPGYTTVPGDIPKPPKPNRERLLKNKTSQGKAKNPIERSR